MIINKHHQKGIGLIEVLIAAVIFALGSLALVQLQGDFFKSSSAAQARSGAMSLAQEKLEDLRGFAATSGNFVVIANNLGGRTCVAGTDDPDVTPTVACTGTELSRPNGTVARNNVSYARSWTVTNFYYDTAGTLLNETACTSSSICGPDNTSLPAVPDQKNIVVTVAWTDTDGTAQTLTDTGIINANSTAAGGALIAATGGSGEKPLVPHTELAAPDVIPTKLKNPPPLDYSGDDSDWDGLTDQQKQDEYAKLGYCNVETFASTEAPDPDLNTNPELDNVLVRFTSSKYQKYTPCVFNASNDYTITDVNDTRTIKYTDDEFLTINCSCELAGSGAGQDQSGASVTKARTGTKTGASNQQSEFCDLCCRDHHENITGDNICSAGANLENCYDPFRTPGADYVSSDHKHFLSSDLTTVVGVGGQYTEVCRIKRVDGFYNVVPDWKMIALNTMVENELNDASEATSYQSYIGTTVNSYLNGAALSGWAATTPDVPTTGVQMMSRSIYVDYMTAAEITTAAPSGDTVDARVPFYEYKTTQISDWTTTASDGSNSAFDTGSPCSSAASANGACVDSPSITAIVTASTTPDKGIYRYSTTPTADIKIVSTMTDSNSGVVAEPAIDSSDNIELTSEYTVAYGASAPPIERKVQMTTAQSLTCPTTWTGQARTSIDITNWNAISLTCSPVGSTSSCDGYSTDQAVTVSAALNTATLGCTYDVAKTCPSIQPALITSLNGSYSCSVVLTKSGSGTACNLACTP